MPNVHTTLTSLFSAIANAIRGKTGSSAQIVADDFPSAIDAIPTGTPLPPLTDPASASDILDGKEAIDGQGQKLTGTLVPPVDTGENGLYKAVMSNEATQFISDEITSLDGEYALAYRTNLVKVSLPNLETMGESCFRYCSNLTGIVNMPKATLEDMSFLHGGRRTIVLYVKELKSGALQGATINTATYNHLWMPNEVKWYNGATGRDMFSRNAVSTVQIDNIPSISGKIFGGDKITALILRNPNGTTLAAALSNISTRKIYVPKSLYSTFYATETNWVTLYNAGGIKPIDEDTTATVGTAFTPTTTATVDHWDQVDLQSYSVGTIDTTTGAITPTHDGRLLIRGLDSSDNIVHVTYLQIGTGFDEEANLA